MLNEERIRKLIELVDSECKKKRLLKRDAFQLILVGAVGVMATYMYMSIDFSGYETTLPSEVIVALNVAYTALIISAVQLFYSALRFVHLSTVNEWTDWNFKKLSKREEVEEKEKPFLKALIKMKCREFGFCLLDIYEENPTLFEDDILLKKLYEAP